MSANGIAHLATKQARQAAKLALAATKRAATGRRSTADITELPTQYVGNTPVSNLLEGGLKQGRPWVSFLPTALFAASEKGVWYDPSDIFSLFQDVAGTIPVTASGQSVALMKDKSGNGAHATQATAGARPTFYVYPSGYGCLSFNGTSQFMISSSINFTGTAVMTATAGFQVASGATGPRLVIELSADTNINNGAFYMTGPATSADHSVGASGTLFLAAGIANVNPSDDILTGQYDLSQATQAAEIIPRLNGVTKTGAAITWTGTTTGTTTTKFGNYPLYIGARGGTSFFFKGHFYGAVVRGATSNATQITQTEAWVTARLY